MPSQRHQTILKHPARLFAVAFVALAGCGGATYGIADAGPEAATDVAVGCASGDGAACPPSDAAPESCTVYSVCSGSQECVFAPGCSDTGLCAPRIACDEPQVFCGCQGHTYLGCQATSPLAHAGDCTSTDAGRP